MSSIDDNAVSKAQGASKDSSLGYSALVLLVFVFLMIFILLMRVCYQNHRRLKKVEAKEFARPPARRLCDGELVREKQLDASLTADIEEAVLKTLHTNLIIALCSIKKESIHIPEESVLSYVSRHGGMRESSFQFEFGTYEVPIPKIKPSQPIKECKEHENERKA